MPSIKQGISGCDAGSPVLSLSKPVDKAINSFLSVGAS